MIASDRLFVKWVICTLEVVNIFDKVQNYTSTIDAAYIKIDKMSTILVNIHTVQ